ncbi:hypothetical protein IE81DRAFT_322878 [Ceraceosorus guamensis]|uniref:Uncharacterized protein n=1 Tax=Ceraceosorus guamensis TaxID=1522189 RepID=A0A316W5M4_9BASI|nr:hypothetical protein IE81DRAFT_322878 [Ceraceosorus guamensis]PWN42955.1 hypothetical protein IE81DRAFT_322878 [Ceraceosorus guamensis]
MARTASGSRTEELPVASDNSQIALDQGHESSFLSLGPDSPMLGSSSTSSMSNPAMRGRSKTISSGTAQPTSSFEEWDEATQKFSAGFLRRLTKRPTHGDVRSAFTEEGSVPAKTPSEKPDDAQSRGVPQNGYTIEFVTGSGSGPALATATVTRLDLPAVVEISPLPTANEIFPATPCSPPSARRALSPPQIVRPARDSLQLSGDQSPPPPVVPHRTKSSLRGRNLESKMDKSKKRRDPASVSNSTLPDDMLALAPPFEYRVCNTASTVALPLQKLECSPTLGSHIQHEIDAQLRRDVQSRLAVPAPMPYSVLPAPGSRRPSLRPYRSMGEMQSHVEPLSQTSTTQQATLARKDTTLPTEASTAPYPTDLRARRGAGGALQISINTPALSLRQTRSQTLRSPGRRLFNSPPPCPPPSTPLPAIPSSAPPMERTPRARPNRADGTQSTAGHTSRSPSQTSSIHQVPQTFASLEDTISFLAYDERRISSSSTACSSAISRDSFQAFSPAGSIITTSGLSDHGDPQTPMTPLEQAWDESEPKQTISGPASSCADAAAAAPATKDLQQRSSACCVDGDATLFSCFGNALMLDTLDTQCVEWASHQQQHVEPNAEDLGINFGYAI